MSNFNKTIQELEGKDWGEPEFPSHLVTECHRLRRVPLREFTIENLRIMIGQNIGLEYLVPIALTALENNPLAEGNFYRGDLLQNVVKVTEEYWQAHPEEWARMVDIKNDVLNVIETIDEIRADLERFKF